MCKPRDFFRLYFLTFCACSEEKALHNLRVTVSLDTCQQSRKDGAEQTEEMHRDEICPLESYP